MNFRTVAAVVVGISLLSGCTAAGNLRDAVVPPEQPVIAVPEPSADPETPDGSVVVVGPDGPAALPSPSDELAEPKPWEVDDRPLKPQLIPPDPTLVESMQCLPVPTDTLEFALETSQAGYNGMPLSGSAMVEVGEGLNPGEVWWVVATAFELEPEKAAVFDSPIVRLTNQPGLSAGERGTWITTLEDDQGRHMWHHVKWQDEGDFVRLQSAAAKALSCTLGSTG